MNVLRIRIHIRMHIRRYNKIQLTPGQSEGIYSCENPQTLQRDLKETMGFDGFVVSVSHQTDRYVCLRLRGNSGDDRLIENASKCRLLLCGHGS